MDKISKNILLTSGIFFDKVEELDGLLIEREMLISTEKYDNIKDQINELKKHLSSGTLTALHKEAKNVQKWPLLNLVRQILGVYGYKMEPVRKSNGYTSDGKKIFKRYFCIIKKGSSD